MQDVDATIISQYANSPTIRTLIENANAYLDPSANIDQFYDLVWNVDTAQGWGLDVWGRIVGVTRNLQIASGDYFGFEEASNVSAAPFGQAPFYSGQALLTNFSLLDDDFRNLIYAKALANICDGSIPSINAILLTVFKGRGNCYVVDGMDRTMQLYFTFPLTNIDAAILAQSGVFPRPSGTNMTITQGPYS